MIITQQLRKAIESRVQDSRPQREAKEEAAIAAFIKKKRIEKKIKDFRALSEKYEKLKEELSDNYGIWASRQEIGIWSETKFREAGGELATDTARGLIQRLITLPKKDGLALLREHGIIWE